MRKRFHCDDEDMPAPRQGCRCRGCYRVRELALDPRLIDLFREGEFSVLPTGQPGEFSMKAIGPARQIVRRAVEMYLIGQVEWAALYIEIVRLLVEQNDELFRRSMDLLNRQPNPIFLADKP